MRLDCLRQAAVDVVHYYDASTGDIISSVGNRFSVQLGGESSTFEVPVPRSLRVPMYSRLGRRALRLDKSNVAINQARDGLVVLYRGAIWFYELATGTLRRTQLLRQSRNALHGGLAVTDDGIFFGEYGANSDRLPVPVWGSRDDGRSWKIVWETPARCKHIHAVYVDPYSERLWIPTGDFEGECFVYSADRAFREVIPFGDGSQKWRPVSMFFEQDRIWWVMDTQLETSFLQEFDRATGQLTQHRAFPGPCWYGKHLVDGWAVIQTTVEPGPGVKTNHAHVYASRDLIEWEEVARFKKDNWPARWFKSGVIAFADGPQHSGDFVLFGEALQHLDGKAMFASLHADS